MVIICFELNLKQIESNQLNTQVEFFRGLHPPTQHGHINTHCRGQKYQFVKRLTLALASSQSFRQPRLRSVFFSVIKGTVTVFVCLGFGLFASTSFGFALKKKIWEYVALCFVFESASGCGRE